MNPVEIAYNKGYRVSREGLVTNAKGISVKTRDLYPRFHIRTEVRKLKWVAVHRLQAFQKFGHSMFANGIEVRHLDNNSRNAHWDNIALGTKSQNAMDKTPETRIRCARAAAKAATKHNHPKIIQHYNEFGFGQTLRAFSIGKGSLSFILNHSTTARELREKFALNHP